MNRKRSLVLNLAFPLEYITGTLSRDQSVLSWRWPSPREKMNKKSTSHPAIFRYYLQFGRALIKIDAMKKVSASVLPY